MRRVPFRSVLVVAAAALAVAAWRWLPLRERTADLLERLHGLGWWGLAGLGLLYTPVAVLLGPAWLLTIGAGAFFDFGPALVAASLGSTTAAAVAFLLGRTAARGWVEARLGGDVRLRALDRAVGRRGFWIVLLTRLSPLFPYVVLNYAFSLTRISLRDFVLASWVGMLPGTVLYLYLGSLTKTLTGTAPETGPAGRALFFLGLGATLAVTILLGRIARRALNETLDEANAGRQPASGATPTGD
jgi:uncharacterized membrane protein YdjX (TVP38/TMEM64 family)